MRRAGKNMKDNVHKFTNIRMTPDTLLRLGKLGNFGETYEDVIKRLLEEKK